MRKDKLKGLGAWILKAVIVYGFVVIAICQIEFEIRITKKKTGIFQNLANIADNVYSGYKTLTSK